MPLIHPGSSIGPLTARISWDLSPPVLVTPLPEGCRSLPLEPQPAFPTLFRALAARCACASSSAPVSHLASPHVISRPPFRYLSSCSQILEETGKETKPDNPWHQQETPTHPHLPNRLTVLTVRQPRETNRLPSVPSPKPLRLVCNTRGLNPCGRAPRHRCLCLCPTC
jgi:hypothetical protein